ncbi:MAG: hypothetical protein H0T62_05425 [Parachlamydiaceae bacterium]|nr:hypothetical protein [Parachlamydiaceae bacterium]
MNFEPKIISRDDYPFAVKADKALNSCPFLSTLSSLVHLAEKCLVIPMLEAYNPDIIKNSPYLSHIDNKKISKIILLLIPGIGNIIFYGMKCTKVQNTIKWFNALPREELDKMLNNAEYRESFMTNPDYNNQSKRMVNDYIIFNNITGNKINEMSDQKVDFTIDVLKDSSEIQEESNSQKVSTNSSKSQKEEQTLDKCSNSSSEIQSSDVKLLELREDALNNLKVEISQHLKNVEKDLVEFEATVEKSFSPFDLPKNISLHNFLVLFYAKTNNCFEALKEKNVNKNSLASTQTLNRLIEDYKKINTDNTELKKEILALETAINNEVKLYSELSLQLGRTSNIQADSIHPIFLCKDYKHHESFSRNKHYLSNSFDVYPNEYPVLRLDVMAEEEVIVNNIHEFKVLERKFLDMVKLHEIAKIQLPKEYPHSLPTFLSATGTIEVKSEGQFNIVIELYNLYFKDVQVAISDLNKIIEKKLAFKADLKSLCDS